MARGHHKRERQQRPPATASALRTGTGLVAGAREAAGRLSRSKLRFLLAPAAVYGALWPLVNVEYLAHWFPLPFMTGWIFFRRYTRAIGGPAQYCAGFFTQSYSRHWAGVLALTLLALTAWAVARGLFRRFSKASCNWLAAAFPVLILGLVGRDLSVLFVLPMVAGLSAAWLYAVLSDFPRSRWGQWSVVAVGLAASIPLYWLLGSGFLYLCAISALLEALVRKRAVASIAWVVAAAAVPQAMSYVLFEPNAAARYLRWMTIPERDAVTTSLVVAMYLLVPVGALAAFLASRLPLGDRVSRRLGLAVRVAGFVLLALLTSRLAVQRFDTSGWIYADYLRDAGRPEEALASLARPADVSDPARFLTLFALERSGRLPWEMFHYPQVASSDALLLRDSAWDSNPAIANWRSDLYLELGRVNEAQRWVHEELSVEGETARVLERAALTYVLNDNPEAARTFIRALDKVPFQGPLAKKYLAALDNDPRLQSDPLVARVRPLMLRKDYVGDWTTEQLLQQSLDANPSNRTAFEYLLAHYLLTSDMNGLAGMAPRLKEFYRVLPTHVQEALLGYKNVNGALPPGVDPSSIDFELETRFQKFIQTWSRYQNGSAEEAWKVLAPDYGATWWFFYIFDRTAAGPAPDAGAGPGAAKVRR